MVQETGRPYPFQRYLFSFRSFRTSSLALSCSSCCYSPIMSSSPLRMRLFEPGGVTLFESLFKSLQVSCSRRILELFSRALLLEILVSRHVQLRFRRQHCAARRFLSGLLTDFISGAFFRRCAVSRAMCVQHREATHDDRRYSNQHSETHRL